MPIDCLNHNVPVYDPDEKGCYEWMSVKAGKPSKFCDDVTIEGDLIIEENATIRHNGCFSPGVAPPPVAPRRPTPLVMTITNSRVYTNVQRKRRGGPGTNDWSEITQAQRDAITQGHVQRPFPFDSVNHPLFDECNWESGNRDIGDGLPAFDYPNFNEINTFFPWNKGVVRPLVGEYTPYPAGRVVDYEYDGDGTGVPFPQDIQRRNIIHCPEGYVAINSPGQYMMTINLSYVSTKQDQTNTDVSTIQGFASDPYLWFKVIDYTTDPFNWKSYCEVVTVRHPARKSQESYISATGYFDVTQDDIDNSPYGQLRLHTFLYIFNGGRGWNSSQSLVPPRRPPISSVLLLGQDRNIYNAPAGTLDSGGEYKGATSLVCEWMATSQPDVRDTFTEVGNGESGLVGGDAVLYNFP
jgi:hypothetical protein